MHRRLQWIDVAEFEFKAWLQGRIPKVQEWWWMQVNKLELFPNALDLEIARVPELAEEDISASFVSDPADPSNELTLFEWPAPPQPDGSPGRVWVLWVLAGRPAWLLKSLADPSPMSPYVLPQRYPNLLLARKAIAEAREHWLRGRN